MHLTLNLPILSLLLTTSTAQGASHIPGLVTRQSTDCSAFGRVACGSYCIPPDYECCEAIEAGCRPGTYCDGVGCCPDGETCVGGGGIDEGTLTATSTSTHTLTSTAGGGGGGSIPSTTSSVPVIPTSSSPPSSSGSASGGPSQSGTPSASSPPVFTGAAGRLDAEQGFCAIAGLLAGAALL